MSSFRFEHRDGLVLEDALGRARLRWRDCEGLVLTESEMRWLLTAALPAAIAAIASPNGKVSPNGTVRVAEPLQLALDA